MDILINIYHSVKNNSSIIYLILPLLFSLFLNITPICKNPIWLRRTSVGFYFINLILLFLNSASLLDKELNIFSFNFIIDKTSYFLIILANLLFFIFSIFSKSFISKLHRVFYSTIALILTNINLIISSNSIIFDILAIFWLILLGYFLHNSFITEEKSKVKAKNKLIYNLTCFFGAIVLISYDFIRYFLFNDIALNFSNLKDSLYQINSLSILLAFIGFGLLIQMLYEFIPSNINIISNKNIKANFVSFINTISNLFIGTVLIIKCYSSFDFIFSIAQVYIAIYLIINLLYFVLVSFKQNSVMDFLSSTLKAHLSIVLFTLLNQDSSNLKLFSYYLISIILSYSFAYIILLFFSSKNKTDLIDNFSKLNNKDKAIKNFGIIAFLNLLKIPFLPLFLSTFSSLSLIFSIEYESYIVGLLIYVLIFGLFCLEISFCNAFYKIFIFSTKKEENNIQLSKFQIYGLVILLFVMILFGLFTTQIFEQFHLNAIIGGI